ncbi:hypothetical protein THAOC_36474, partial [Thalassiosira oceanica]
TQKGVSRVWGPKETSQQASKRRETLRRSINVAKAKCGVLAEKGGEREQPRRYRRNPSPSTRGGRPDSLDSGGSGHGLRIFQATLHRGEKDRESRLAHQADTHHEVDSRRESRQSSAFRQPPEASGGST